MYTTDEPRNFLAHILVYHRTQADKLTLTFPMNPHILNSDILQAHVLTRFKEEWGHGKVYDV
jgi:hypothetical protein